MDKINKVRSRRTTNERKNGWMSGRTDEMRKGRKEMQSEGKTQGSVKKQ